MFGKSIFDIINVECSLHDSILTPESQNYLPAENYMQDEERFGNEMLIRFHKIYGNKWKQISNHLATTSDSFIKNMFYTLIRKALRKVNIYIQLESKTKGKKPRVFKLNFVFKLANLAESERITDLKQNFNSVRGFYTKLLYNLLEVKNIDPEYLKILIKCDEEQQEEIKLKKHFESLIQNLRVIEKIFIEQNLIKKGRTKKKFPKKGLIQKAYTSKIFKKSLQDLKLEFPEDLSIADCKQLITQTSIIQSKSNVLNVCQVDAPGQFFEQTNENLDKCLQVRSFDPILFE